MGHFCQVALGGDLCGLLSSSFYVSLRFTTFHWLSHCSEVPASSTKNCTDAFFLGEALKAFRGDPSVTCTLPLPEAQHLVAR